MGLRRAFVKEWRRAALENKTGKSDRALSVELWMIRQQGPRERASRAVASIPTVVIGRAAPTKV